MAYYKDSHKKFDIDGQKVVIPPGAWANFDKKTAPGLTHERNLNLFDYKSKSFRYVVTLSPIKTKIRRLEVCITDMVGIFRDFRIPVLFDYRRTIKREHNLHLRVLFPGENRPRIIPIEQCRLYNSLNKYDKESVNWFNSYAAELTYMKDDLGSVDKMDATKWVRYLLLKRKQMSYWNNLRKIEYTHLNGNNGRFQMVLG